MGDDHIVDRQPLAHIQAEHAVGEAARPFRRAVASGWSVDETDTKGAGKPVDVYRARYGPGQVVDVCVSERRAAAAAATCFGRAIDAADVIRDEVATDGAATNPPALSPPSRPSRTRRARRPNSASSAIIST